MLAIGAGSGTWLRPKARESNGVLTTADTALVIDDTFGGDDHRLFVGAGNNTPSGLFGNGTIRGYTQFVLRRRHARTG